MSSWAADLQAYDARRRAPQAVVERVEVTVHHPTVQLCDTGLTANVGPSRPAGKRQIEQPQSNPLTSVDHPVAKPRDGPSPHEPSPGNPLSPSTAHLNPVFKHRGIAQTGSPHTYRPWNVINGRWRVDHDVRVQEAREASNAAVRAAAAKAPVNPVTGAWRADPASDVAPPAPHGKARVPMPDIVSAHYDLINGKVLSHDSLQGFDARDNARIEKLRAAQLNSTVTATERGIANSERDIERGRARRLPLGGANAYERSSLGPHQGVACGAVTRADADISRVTMQPPVRPQLRASHGDADGTRARLDATLADTLASTGGGDSRTAGLPAAISSRYTLHDVVPTSKRFNRSATVVSAESK